MAKKKSKKMTRVIEREKKKPSRFKPKRKFEEGGVRG